jgi:response regulator receiver domain-containing protein
MSQGRVLVIDDEAEVRKSVRLILVKAGYDVDEAGDPEAGVEMVKSARNPVPLSAIITDLNMPQINEVIVIPYLRSQFPSCPVVVTGPPWLYQVECHLRTVLGRDRFRSGWPQPQGPMGTNLVVVSSPTFHEHLHLPQCSKQFPIQQFVA